MTPRATDSAPYDQRDFLPTVTAEEWAIVVAHCEARTFPTGTSLYAPGGADGLLAAGALLFLLDGAIKGSAADDGSVIDVLPPGMLGTSALLTGEMLLLSEIEVVRDARCLVLSADALRLLADAAPRVALALVLDVTAETLLSVSGRARALRLHADRR